MANRPTIIAPAWPSEAVGCQRITVSADLVDAGRLLATMLCASRIPILLLDNQIVAVIEFTEDADLLMFYLSVPDAEPFEWSADERIAYLEPCDDPDELQQWVTSDAPYGRLRFFVVADVHVQNERAYRQFLSLCRERPVEFEGFGLNVAFA